MSPVLIAPLSNETQKVLMKLAVSSSLADFC